MQFLRRLSLVDFALIAALVVVGVLAVMNQRDPTPGTGGVALTSENIAAFQTAVDDLYAALATGQPADGAFAALATAVETAGDTALAPVVADLGTAYAMADEARIADALRTINGLLGTSPFAEYVLSAYAGGTLNNAFNVGTTTPATGREWVHLIWVQAAGDDTFVGWDIATGEATWTVEPGNTAVNLTFTVPEQGYTGTVRLAPAGPAAFVEVVATFSAALLESIVALGEPVDGQDLIIDLGEATNARPGQPWSGETRLGEPPRLLDDLRRAEAIEWTATVPDGRTFVMRIMMGATGRAAIASVFPA